MEIIKLYHGTIREYGERILEERRFKFTEGKRHLLGCGIYFYDCPFHALHWARMMVKNKYEGHLPMVIEAIIEYDPDKYLDLDRYLPQQDFYALRRYYLNLQLARECRQSGDFYYTDSRFVDFLVNQTDDKMVSKTFAYTIRSEAREVPVVYTSHKGYKNVTKHHRTERQYCLKTNDWIIDVDEFFDIET